MSPDPRTVCASLRLCAERCSRLQLRDLAYQLAVRDVPAVDRRLNAQARARLDRWQSAQPRASLDRRPDYPSLEQYRTVTSSDAYAVLFGGVRYYSAGGPLAGCVRPEGWGRCGDGTRGATRHRGLVRWRSRRPDVPLHALLAAVLRLIDELEGALRRAQGDGNEREDDDQ